MLQPIWPQLTSAQASASYFLIYFGFSRMGSKCSVLPPPGVLTAEPANSTELRVILLSQPKWQDYGYMLPCLAFCYFSWWFRVSLFSSFSRCSRIKIQQKKSNKKNKIENCTSTPEERNEIAASSTSLPRSHKTTWPATMVRFIIWVYNMCIIITKPVANLGLWGGLRDGPGLADSVF